MLAFITGTVQADPVPARVDEDRFTPQPGPVRRLLFEIDSPRLQFDAQFVQCFVLEIDRDAGLRRHGLHRMQ